VHTKLTGELISFGLSDRSVRSLANRSAWSASVSLIPNLANYKRSHFGWSLMSVRI